MADKYETLRLPEVETIMAGSYGQDLTPMIRRLCWTILKHWGDMPEWMLDDEGRDLPIEQETERSVLALIYRSPQHAEPIDRLIERLESADFGHEPYRFLFDEARLMMEAGEPLSDSSTMIRWLRSRASRGRALAAGVGVSLPAIIATELLDPKFYASLALADHYLGVLRAARMRRSFVLLSAKLRMVDRDNPGDPVGTLKWLQSRVDELFVKADEVFPEAMAT
jgi:hypothetical protein